MASVLDGRAAVAASKTRMSSWTKLADMEAAALAVADLGSFPLEPATSVQKSAVSVSSISNDASRHLNLCPIRGCKYDFEAVTMVTPGCHGILLVPNLLL